MAEAQSIDQWMNFSKLDSTNYISKFEEHHIGNPLIRSLHGGVVGTMIEMVAASAAIEELQSNENVEIDVANTNVNYMRVTKDADLYASFEIVRRGRRVIFVDVVCWQDEPELAVAKGNCMVRISNGNEKV